MSHQPSGSRWLLHTQYITVVYGRKQTCVDTITTNTANEGHGTVTVGVTGRVDLHCRGAHLQDQATTVG